LGEGDPLPRGKELTEGPIGRRGSLTRAQTDRQRDWSQGVSGCQRGDSGKSKTCGRKERGELTSPWWIHRPGSGVAAVLKDNEHSWPMAGWNVVLLQLFGDTVLQDKCLLTVYIFIC